MGRKIPGRKHKGVKDPEKQQSARLKLLKTKINRAPTNPDDQPIPKSLQKIIDLKKKLASGEIKKPKIKKPASAKSGQELNVKEKPSTAKKRVKRIKKSEKAPANFSQLPGESDRTFLGRVNLAVRDYLKEAEFENKFGVSIKRNAQTGEVIGVEKQPKDEIIELMKKARNKSKKKKKGNELGQPSLTKTQKRSVKLAEKKRNKELQKIDEFAKYTDNVRFGEIAHGPPSLTVPRKVSKTNLAPRPGVKDLLLKQKLAQPTRSSVLSANARIAVNKKPSEKVQKINKKGKRKDLPVAMRRQLETVQSEVMKAYKTLKSQMNTVGSVPRPPRA